MGIKIKYGGEEIDLHKSEGLIAVKKKADATTTPEIVEKSIDTPTTENVGRLGSFELLSADETGAALDSIRQDPNTAIGTHVFHFGNQDDTQPLVPNGKIYLVFTADTTEERCEQLLAEYALVVLEHRGNNTYIASVTPQSPNPIKVAVALQQYTEVETAEPDFVAPVQFHAFSMPNDTLLQDQWHLRNTGKNRIWGDDTLKKGADANVVPAWEALQSLGSPSIRIAIIDDGFDTTHPDLRGDGTKVKAAWDFASNSPNVMPRDTFDAHGTQCAGVALGAANASGIIGVAPNAGFVPVRFNAVSDDLIERYFKFCTDNKVHIISCSWGMPNEDWKMSTRIHNAIKQAATVGWNGKGMVICFAAGNEGRRISGFATHPDIVCVSASNSQDEFSSDYSNYGSNVMICAPSNGNGGAGISTTDIRGEMGSGEAYGSPSYDPNFTGPVRDSQDFYAGFGGTSSACPLVAGVCALILSANPNLSAAQIKTILQKTSKRIGSDPDYDAHGHSPRYGYGRIDAHKAVLMARAAGGGTVSPPPPVVPKPPAPPVPKPPTVPTAPTIERATAIVNAKDLNVRSGPGTQFPILRKLALGTRVTLLAKVDKWMKIGENEYCHADYLVYPSVTQGTSLANDLNVRSGPGTQFDVLRKLKAGEKVNVMQSSNGWYRISANEWVSARYIKIG